MLELQPYEGYTGYIHSVDPDDNVLVGRVAGIRDVVTFVGATFADLQREFEKSVSEYLAFCREQGKAPDKPYSGHFQVRIAPEDHRKAAVKAEARRLSLNAFIAEVIHDAVAG